MKWFKQFLSVLLVAVFTLAAVPVTAGAYTTTEWDGLICIKDWDGELLKLRLYEGDNDTYLLSVEGIPEEAMNALNTFLAKDNNNFSSTTFSAYYIDSNHNRHYDCNIYGRILCSYRTNATSVDGSYVFKEITSYFEKGINGYNCVYVFDKSYVKILDIKKWNDVYFCLGAGTYGSGKGGGWDFMNANIKDVDLTLSEKAEAPKQDISDLTFGKVSNYTYNGKAKQPAVTIKDGSYKLEKGKDYTVSYKNNTNIGKATITVKGMGDYTGTKTITFNIVPKKTTLKVKTSGSKATLTWVKVSGAEKYEIYYSINGGKYKKLTTVTGSKTSVSLKNLDFDTNTYKFKIRATAKSSGKTYRGSFSNVVKTS